MGNSLSRIEGLPETSFKALRDILSYTEAGYYPGSGRPPAKRFLIDRKGAFPTGLLYLVDKFLEAMPVPAKRVDLRIKPKYVIDLFTQRLPYPLYPEQIAAGEAAMAANRGIISMPTGSGKSVVISEIINRLQVPTLVVVPSLELKRQLTASLSAAYGRRCVGGKGQLIWVENVDALDTKVPIKGYDCVIIDEFHHSAASTYRKLNTKAWGDIYYRFGLTATPFRANDDERLLLESVLSKVIYSILYQTCVDLKRIVPIEAYYIDLPLTQMKGNPNSWPAVYSELVVNNEYRNGIICSLLGKFHANKLATLCLVKEIKHGEILSDWATVPFANGAADNTRQLILEFILGETTSLIGTTGVIGEGIDTKPAEWLIAAAGGKSKNQFMQQIGRVLRLHPGKETGKVILFRDASNKWLLNHFKAQVKILKEEYGVVPVKLEL